MIMTEQEYIKKIEAINKAYQDKLNELVGEYTNKYKCFVKHPSVLNSDQQDLIKEFVQICEKLDNAGVTMLYPVDQNNPNVYFVNSSNMYNIKFLCQTDPIPIDGLLFDYSHCESVDKTLIPIELYENNHIMCYEQA